MAIDWDKAYKDIGSNSQSNTSSKAGSIDWDKAYQSIGVPTQKQNAAVIKAENIRKEQKLKELNAMPMESKTQQEASKASEKVANRSKLIPKQVSIAIEGAKLSPEARVIFAEKNSTNQAKTAGAVAANKFIDSSTMGLYSTLEKKQAEKFGTKGQELLKLKSEAEKKHPVAATIGTIAGYVAPGAAAEKVAGKALAPVLGKVSSKVAQKAITGAATGGGMELVEGAIRGETPKDIAKRVAIGAGLGAAGDVAVYGAGKGISSIAQKLKAGKTLTKAEEQIIKNTASNTEALKQPVKEAKSNLKALTPTNNKTSLKSTTEPYNINTLDNAKLKQIATDNGINPNQTKSQLRTALKQTQTEKNVVQPEIVKSNTKKLTQPINSPEPIASGELKERGLSKNIRTDMNRPDAERAVFDKNPEMYNVLNNETTLQSAQRRFSNGYENALKDFDNTKGNLRADNVPLAKLIADEAVKRGDVQTARRVLVDVSESLTTAGQYSQAAKILRESNDPSTVIDFINREINKLNTQGTKRYGNRWKTIDLSPEELNKLKEMPANMTDEQKEQLFSEIGNSITSRIPTTAREKVDAWRRISMLFNPKTHVRNVVGNGIMAGVQKISDTIATTLEKGLKPELRTKSFAPSKEYKDIATSYWNANKKALTESGRWELFGIKSPFAEKKTFKTKWLETLNNVSKNTLENEDLMFMKYHFENNLAGFMQARGLKEPTQEAVGYATRRAQEATFREANEFANAINKLKGTKGGLIIEAAIPFTKTPANILTTGVRYSPIGLINSAVQLINKEAPAKAIETFSKGLTGSGLTMLGFYMAKNGLARGQYEDNAKVEGLKQASGELPNSIITPKGSYTIDWAQPASIPFFMGVGAAESIKKNGGDDYLDIAKDALIAGGDSLINQSMLKNIKDIFGGYGSTTEKVLQLPVSYLQQGFPTAAGQIARINDPFKRQTDYSSSTSRTLTGLQSKTPGLSKDLPLKRDILGEPQKYGEGITNAIQQLISPGYIAKKSDDPIIKELNRLYESEGSEFLPRATVYKFTKDKIDYKLTNNEISQFQSIMGAYTKDNLKSLIQSQDYRSMPDSEKAKAVKKINDDGYELAKQMIINRK